MDVRFSEQYFCRNHLHYRTANHSQLLGRFKNTQHTEEDAGEKRYFFLPNIKLEEQNLGDHTFYLLCIVDHTSLIVEGLVLHLNY